VPQAGGREGRKQGHNAHFPADFAGV
jgi:hypothetical protein